MNIKSKIESLLPTISSKNNIGFVMSFDRVIFFVPNDTNKRIIAAAYVRTQETRDREPKEDATASMTEEEASKYDSSKEDIDFLKSYLDDEPYYVNSRMRSTAKAMHESTKKAHFSYKRFFLPR